MINIRRLSLEDAGILLEGASVKAREIGVPMCTAICDESGNLVAFQRMDGAKITSIDIAINKAFTAAGAKRATREYNEIAVPGKPAFGIHTTNRGRFTIIGGGVPVTYENQVVGSVGVSGGTAEQDEKVAIASVQHYIEKSKPLR